MNCEKHGQPLTACQACIDEVFAKKGYHKGSNYDIQAALRKDYVFYFEKVAIHIDHDTKRVVIKPVETAIAST